MSRNTGLVSQLVDLLNLIPSWQLYSILIGLVVFLYYARKLFNKLRKKKPDDKGEISRINELYRGLNSEDSML